MRTPVPRPIRDTKPMNGDVKIYFLTPEELEKYRNLKPPRDRNGELLRKSVHLK